MHLKSLVLAGLVAALALPGAAGEAGDLTREALYAGDLDGGLERLAPLAAADDPEAAFGIGFIHFTSGHEGFANALYRHGLAAPETGPMGPAVACDSAQPQSEPLDYAGVRAILEQFVEPWTLRERALSRVVRPATTWCCSIRCRFDRQRRRHG